MAIRLPNLDKRHYMVRCKYPLSNIFREDSFGVSGEQSEVRDRQNIAAKKYHKELLQKSDQEIDGMYSELIRRAQEAEERSFFFNKPESDADFDYWSKMEYWTIDEAIALSLGKNPEMVKSKILDTYKYSKSPLAIEYGKRLNLAKRAVNSKKLYDYTIPTLFLRWMKDNEIEFPEELEGFVAKKSGNLIDWKKKYEELLKEYEVMGSEAKEHYDRVYNSANELLKDRAKNSKSNKYGLNTNEVNTLFKLIAGMAIVGYSYNPDASKNPATSDIEKDTGISSKTAKKWIDKSIEIVDSLKEDKDS